MQITNQFPQLMRALIKVETAIMRDLINLLAFRVYLPEFMKEVNQTVERGESPRLLAKLTKRRGTPEI